MSADPSPARGLRGAVESAPERGRETKERLLDAAEGLFAERGFGGTSLRAVTQAAGASVSAANYHFGSKEALLRATLLRRVEPVNRRRFERLDALERAAGGQPLRLEAILEAFLRPLFEERATSPEAPARHRQVAARLYSDPPQLVAALKHELFASVSARFLDALARAIPGKTRGEIALAFQFTVGVMVHVISGHLEGLPGIQDLGAEGGGGGPSDEVLLAHVIAYVAAGLRAGSALEGVEA
jgi:AcrR family transcriptional regulator